MCVGGGEREREREREREKERERERGRKRERKGPHSKAEDLAWRPLRCRTNQSALILRLGIRALAGKLWLILLVNACITAPDSKSPPLSISKYFYKSFSIM